MSGYKGSVGWERNGSEKREEWKFDEGVKGCWGKKGRVEDTRQGWRRWSMERGRVRQVRIIGGLLSPRAPPRTLSTSREPAHARRGRREFPAECKVQQTLKPVVHSAKCKVHSCTVQGATDQPMAREDHIHAAISETGCDTLVVKQPPSSEVFPHLPI